MRDPQLYNCPDCGHNLLHRLLHSLRHAPHGHTARSRRVDRWIRLSDDFTPVIAPIWSST